MFSKQFRSIIFLHGAAWKNQFTQQHSFDWSRADGARQANHVPLRLVQSLPSKFAFSGSTVTWD